MRILSLLLSGLLAAPALAISVSGVVATTDGSSPGGFHIVVEQVGGELPLFSTNTAANGTWAVSDPLLFGNIRVTAADLGVDFRSAPGRRYQLQQSDSLATGTFAIVPGQPVLNGDGSIQRFTVPRGEPRQFFRVVAMP